MVMLYNALRSFQQTILFKDVKKILFKKHFPVVLKEEFEMKTFSTDHQVFTMLLKYLCSDLNSKFPRRLVNLYFDEKAWKPVTIFGVTLIFLLLIFNTVILFTWYFYG